MELEVIQTFQQCMQTLGGGGSNSASANSISDNSSLLTYLCLINQHLKEGTARLLICLIQSFQLQKATRIITSIKH